MNVLRWIVGLGAGVGLLAMWADFLVRLVRDGRTHRTERVTP